MPPATKTAPKHPNLFAALMALQANLPSVKKDQTADTGKYTYTYANLASIAAALTPVLHEHGLVWRCAPVRCEDGTYELQGRLWHESGESLDGSLPLFGRNPQEIGSALTYARRYLLGTLTGVVTENDDDGAHAKAAQGRMRGEAPPPPETPEQRLSNARAGAWTTYRGKYPQGTQEGFVQAYEQWAAQPFADADASDFERFSAAMQEAHA